MPQHVAGAEEAAQHTQQGCTASASAQTLERPRWLKTLQVPRGSSSTAQVVWTPVCWLPPQSVATRADSKHAEAAQAGDADSTSTSTPLQVAWLLAGLPNGGVMLWKVSVDTGHLAMSAAAVCVGQGLRSGPPPRPPQRIPGKAASDGTWRPRSAGCAESPASEAAWHGAGGRATGEVGGSWRQAAAATVERGTVQMPDVHARMLFTLHAIPEAAGGPAQQWRLVSTSYDRKIVSWLLQLDQPRAAARLEPQMIWHGTAAVVSCMCALPVRPCSSPPLRTALPPCEHLQTPAAAMFELCAGSKHVMFIMQASLWSTLRCACMLPCHVYVTKHAPGDWDLVLHPARGASTAAQHTCRMIAKCIHTPACELGNLVSGSPAPGSGCLKRCCCL